MARVLVIEEDEAFRRQLHGLLEAGGILVDEAAAGRTGGGPAHPSPPDLVLFGVRPEDPGGVLALARLRADPWLSKVPAIALGGSACERRLSLAAGAQGFLARPLDGTLPERLRPYLLGEREALPEEDEKRALRELNERLSLLCLRGLAGPGALHPALPDGVKSSFIRNLAHELSTPLTPLAGYLRIVQSGKTGVLTDQQKRIVDSMAHAVGRLIRIIDNLSDFASLQSGNAQIIEAEFSADALADEVVSEHRSAAKDARLNLRVEHAGSPLVMGDARKLRQALSNLVSNAVKFSPHGAEVLVEVVQNADRLRFAVYDQGPGIRGEEQELIFEPLHHAATRTGDEAHVPGSGLGLPVARRIAEAHGGNVFVESPPREQPSGASRFTGSKFVMEVRVRPVDPSTTAEKSGLGSSAVHG